MDNTEVLMIMAVTYWLCLNILVWYSTYTIVKKIEELDTKVDVLKELMKKSILTEKFKGEELHGEIY